MKNKNTKCWFTKSKKLMISIILLFSFLCMQGIIYAKQDFKNLSFSQAERILEKGVFAEVRETADGNLIHRLFLGMNGFEYQDYLIIKDSLGNDSYIPLRTESKFFEILKGDSLKIVLLSYILRLIEKILDNTWAIISFTVLLIVGYFFIQKEQLLSYNLSRIKKDNFLFLNLFGKTT